MIFLLAACLLVIVFIAGVSLIKFGLLEFIVYYKGCKWYNSVLQRLKSGDRLLDVGDGTAYALASSAEVILNKKLVVVCIDKKMSHVRQAVAAIHGTGLHRRELKEKMIVHHKSIFDPNLQTLFTGNATFNAVCFSVPLLQLSDPADALRIAASVLKDGGVIYVPHVAAATHGPLMSMLLKFCKQAPTANVRDIAAEAGMEVLHDLPAFGNDGKKPQIARMLLLQQSSASARVFGKESKGSVLRSRKSVDARI